MLALLLLVFTAQAQDPCAVRIDSETVSTQLNQLRQQIADGDRTVGAELNELFKNTSECMNGPVERRDLGGLLLARGVYGLLSESVEEAAAMQQFTWAYAIAGRDVFDPIYGPDMLEAFDVATTGILPKASIHLAFTRDPRVVVVDGEVVYERGEQVVTATFHLVQWLDAKGWHSQRVVLQPGEEITVGGGGSQESAQPKKSTKKAKKRRKKKPKSPKVRATSRSPKPPKIPLEGARTHVKIHGAYGLLLARLNHETGASAGSLILPLGEASVRWDWGAKLGLYARASLDPGVVAKSVPALLNQGVTGLSFGARGGDSGWNLNLGIALRAMALTQGSGPEDEEPFSTQPAFGGNLALNLRLKDKDFGLYTNILNNGFDIGARGDLQLTEIGDTGLIPTAGLAINFALRKTDTRLSDQAIGTHARLGLKRSF